MSSSSNSSRRLRQSCDRCHGQKLRCIREEGVGEGGPCNRCIRQGADCQYSWCMPKGRPSIYRTAQSSGSIATSHHSARPAPVRASSLASTTTSTPSTAPLPNSGPASTDGDSEAKTPGSGRGDSFMDPSTMDAFICDPMWSWMPSQESSMEVDPMDADFSQWLMQSAQGDSQNFASLDAYPLFPSAAPPLTTDLDFGDLRSSPAADVGGYHSRVSISSNTSDGSTTPASSTSARVNTAIAQLSQLNLRLCALHRTSSALAVVLKSRGVDDSLPIIDDAALKSVTGWLTHISGDFSFLPPPHDPQESMLFATTTIGSTLRDTFSASHHLLDILRDLRADGYSTAEQQYMSGYHQRHNSTASEMSQYSMDGGEYVRNTVIDQLLVSCHSLLLNIFISVYSAILCDSSKWNASTSVDIRPVMVSQVCSYLIGRQNQAVDQYLAQDYQGQQPGAADNSTAAFRAELAHLREEIEKRQMMLRQALRF